MTGTVTGTTLVWLCLNHAHVYGPCTDRWVHLNLANGKPWIHQEHVTDERPPGHVCLSRMRLHLTEQTPLGQPPQLMIPFLLSAIGERSPA